MSKHVAASHLHKKYMMDAIRKALPLLFGRHTALDRKLASIVQGQAAICALCFLYCLITRYTHHQKLLYVLLCAVTVTTVTGVAAANYHNSRSVVAGLFLSCTFVGYAFLHIASREWVFPLHMDNIHDYEI